MLFPAPVFHSARSESRGFRRAAIAVALLALSAALSACGGGGGGGTDASAQGGGSGSGTGSGSGSGSGSSAPVKGTAGSFYFLADASVAQAAGLEQATGGSTFAAWNPQDATNTNRPGLKVSFFGAAAGCAGVHNGKVGGGDASQFAAGLALTGVSAPADSALRWTPEGQAAGCAASSQSASGDSLVALSGKAGGAMAILTASGPHTDGSPAFFGPFGAQGQNGAGGNAFIDGTFVAFRQDWSSANAPLPFARTNTARVYSVQGIASQSGITDAPSGNVVQAKQEVLATFINPTCVSEAAAAGVKRSCQVQYVLATGIFRAGVSDWSTVGWFNAGKVWFDAVQGGATIVEGPVRASGQITTDAASGLALFASAGSATQHQTFASATFDIRIGFDELQNAMRLAVSKQLSLPVATVTDAQVAALFGSTWNVASSWATMAGSVGQELYNPVDGWQAWIGGSFSALYIGPSA